MKLSAIFLIVFSILSSASIIVDYLFDENASSTNINKDNPVGSRDLGLLNSLSFDGLTSHILTNNFLLKLDIKLPPKSLYVLESQRQKTLKSGERPILINPINVNGSISSGDGFVDAKFRLKGELADHWNRNIRTSLAIKLRRAIPGLGMQKFSIMKLHSRQFPADLLHNRLKNYLGLINRNMLPVAVNVNGKEWGLMIAEEHWGKDFFINHRIPEGPIIKFGDHVKYAPYEYYSVHSNVGDVNKKLGREIAYRYFYQPSTVNFATEKWADEIALSELFNSFHTLLYSNLRIYFNPIDGRLYPITSDQDAPSLHSSFSESQRNYYKTGLEYLGFIGRLYSNSNFRDQLAASRIKLRKDIHRLCSKAVSEISAEYPIADLEEWSSSYCDVLRKNAERFDNEGLFPLDWIRDKLDFEHAARSSIFVIATDLGLVVSNGFEEDLRIETLVLGDSAMELPIIIKANSEYLLSSELNLNSICNLPVKITGALISDPYQTYKTSVVCSSFYDTGQYQNLDNLIVYGNVTISENTRVKKLTLSAKSTLTIATDVKLVVDGEIRNLPNESAFPTIVFKGGKSSIDVLMSDNPNANSIIRGLNIYSMGDLKKNSGAALLRFFGGHVEIEGLSMDCPGYEDCLNIVQSSFNLRFSNFSNCSSDCIDIDYSHGDMSHLAVSNAKGDGIDFSKSVVNISNVHINGVFDKGLSIGERSNVFATSVLVANSNACVAVKDGSHLKIDDFELNSCQAFSIAAYIKKKYFLMPTVVIGEGVFEDPIAIQKHGIVSFMNEEWKSRYNLVLLSSKQINNYYTTGFMRKNR